MKYVKIFESWLNEQEDIKPSNVNISKLTIGEFMKLQPIDQKDILESIFSQFKYAEKKPTISIVEKGVNGAKKDDSIMIQMGFDRKSYTIFPWDEENVKPENQNKNIFELMFNVDGEQSARLFLYMDYLRKNKLEIRPDLFREDLVGNMSLTKFRKEEDDKKYFADNKKDMVEGSNSIAGFAQNFYKAAVAKRKKKEES